MRAQIQKLLLALAVVGLLSSAEAQFTLATNNNTITITKYTGPGGDVTIPNTTNGFPIVSIGNNAFKSSSVSSVTLPDTITTIQDDAFYACTSLGSMTIPNGVTKIGQAAFGNCLNLTTVTIPANVASLGPAAFFACDRLAAITVAAQNPVYSSVNGVLFDKNQTALLEYPPGHGQSYEIPSGVITIGRETFENCDSLTNIIIPDTVTNIGLAAFQLCTRLTSVIIPNSVTDIGDSAFEGCAGLTNIVIPNSVTYIEEFAFDGCSALVSVTIPKSVTHIGTTAFAHCPNLTAVYCQGNAPSSDFALFQGDPKVIVYYLPGTKGWLSTFDNLPLVPAVLWNPHASAISVANGQVSFNITGPTNITIVVEACTNLLNPVWVPVSTNVLTGGGASFSESPSENYPGRFYRFRSP